jgi:hypothetical protein
MRLAENEYTTQIQFIVDLDLYGIDSKIVCRVKLIIWKWLPTKSDSIYMCVQASTMPAISLLLMGVVEMRGDGSNASVG